MLNLNTGEAGQRRVVHMCDTGDSGLQVEKNSPLLPGIPDDITVSQISPRLSWKDIYTLSSVSKRWGAIIKSRQIFHARSLFTIESKDTLFAVQGVCHRSKDKEASWNVVLYSPEDHLQQSGARCGCLYALPPNPYDGDQFPFLRRECIFLEGKLYIFRRRNVELQSNLYVCDLVTQELWKRCSPVAAFGKDFQCGVIGRNIYVFYESGDLSVTYAEYNPQGDSWSYVNSWSPFKSAFPDKCLHQCVIQDYQKITRLGEELYVYAAPTCTLGKVSNDQAPRRELLHAYIYHTVTHEWRKIENFRRHEWELVMLIDNRIHRIDRDRMEVYDTRADQWTLKRLSSFPKDLIDEFRLELERYVGSNTDQSRFDELVRVNHQELMHFVDGAVVKNRIFLILDCRLPNWGEEGGSLGNYLRIVSSRWPMGKGDTEELNFELWDSCFDDGESGYSFDDHYWFSGLFKCAVQL